MFKRLFSAICFLAFFAAASAQTAPVKKVYAYKQASFPGKKPSDTRTGTEIKKEHYRLFITSTGKEVISINGVWIMHEYYRFTVSSKPKTPIKMEQPDDGIILVPKTNYKVFEIMPKGKQGPSPKPGTILGKLLKANDVVISYNWRGKQYFATAKTIIELPPFIGL